MPLSRRDFLAVTGAITLGPGVFGSSDEKIMPIVETLRRASNDGQAGIAEELKRLTSTPKRLLSILGEPTRGGLNVLYTDSQITILNIVWAPLMVLRPHDHNMWATIGVYGGREDNIFWKREGNLIKPTGAGSFGVGDVTSLASDAVHSVVNPIPKLTAALHVYGGDFFAPGRTSWAGENQAAEPFSQKGLKNHFEKSNKRFDL